MAVQPEGCHVVRDCGQHLENVSFYPADDRGCPAERIKDLKEAAVIDGANILDIFKNVTWPSIAATCYSTILLMIIWTLNAFTFIYMR